MATYLYRLGKFAYRRKAVVLSLWLAILVLAGIGAATLSGPTSNSFSIPGTPAQAALDLQAQRFGATGDPLTAVKAQYVFKAPDGSTLNTPAYTAAIDRTIANIKNIADVAPASKAAPGTPGALVNPVVGNEQIVAQYAKLAETNGTPADVAAANAAALSPLSANGNVGTLDVSMTGVLADVTQAERDTLDQAAAPARDAGLTVELGGSVAQSNAPPGGSSEAIGLVVAAVVLIIMFGSMVAAALPLITAIVGVGISIAAVTIASGFVSLGNTTSILALMIGLAVAIDYSLFILARYRHELTKTDDRMEAVGRAVGTAGSAVVFAGMTVLIALVALSVVGIPFLTQMGIAAGFAVLIAVLIALTALPALLGLFGKKAFAGKVKFVNTADPEDPKAKPTNGARWARLVTKHPAITLIGGVVLLGVIAGPTTSLSLALPGISTADPSTSVRKAYDLVDAGFGPGKNGPLLVIADAQGVSGNKTQAFADVVRTISQESDVANAQIVLVNQAGDTAQILVTPKSGPTSDATKALVQTIRDAEGALEQSSGVKYGVTGQTALQLDVSTRLQNALIPYLAVVVGLAFILLMLVFRSILVPLTATVGFLLSVLATFGATVFIFQEGGLGLISNPQPIVSFMPVFLIGVVFGLAMDYQVFLVSRMREEYVHGSAPTDAVINGFKYGSRVVTSAAIIMISVFAGFVAQPDSFIKSIGFALAAAVFFDAFVVRMVLIPAVMALLGEKAWWLPGWLDKILPNVDIEGSKLAALADNGKPTSDSDLVGSDRQ